MGSPFYLTFDEKRFAYVVRNISFRARLENMAEAEASSSGFSHLAEAAALFMDDVQERSAYQAIWRRLRAAGALPDGSHVAFFGYCFSALAALPEEAAGWRVQWHIFPSLGNLERSDLSLTSEKEAAARRIFQNLARQAAPGAIVYDESYSATPFPSDFFTVTVGGDEPGEYPFSPDPQALGQEAAQRLLSKAFEEARPGSFLFWRSGRGLFSCQFPIELRLSLFQRYLEAFWLPDSPTFLSPLDTHAGRKGFHRPDYFDVIRDLNPPPFARPSLDQSDMLKTDWIERIWELTDQRVAGASRGLTPPAAAAETTTLPPLFRIGPSGLERYAGAAEGYVPAPLYRGAARPENEVSPELLEIAQQAAQAAADYARSGETARRAAAVAALTALDARLNRRFVSSRGDGRREKKRKKEPENGFSELFEPAPLDLAPDIAARLEKEFASAWLTWMPGALETRVFLASLARSRSLPNMPPALQSVLAKEPNAKTLDADGRDWGAEDWLPYVAQSYILTGRLDLERVAAAARLPVEAAAARLREAGWLIDLPWADAPAGRPELTATDWRNLRLWLARDAGFRGANPRLAQLVESELAAARPEQRISLRFGDALLPPEMLKTYFTDYFYRSFGYTPSIDLFSINAGSPGGYEISFNERVESRRFYNLFDFRFRDCKLSGSKVLSAVLNNRLPSLYKSLSDALQKEYESQSGEEDANLEFIQSSALDLLDRHLQSIDDGFNEWIRERGDDSKINRYIREVSSFIYSTDDVREFDGFIRDTDLYSDLFPHLENSNFSLHKWQKKVIPRIIQEPSLLVARGTGQGKTLSVIASFLALRRAGRVNRLICVVPKSLQDNYAGELRKYAPDLPFVNVASRSSLLFDLAFFRYEKAPVLIISYENFALLPLGEQVGDKSFSSRREEAIFRGQAYNDQNRSSLTRAMAYSLSDIGEAVHGIRELLNAYDGSHNLAELRLEFERGVSLLVEALENTEKGILTSFGYKNDRYVRFKNLQENPEPNFELYPVLAFENWSLKAVRFSGEDDGSYPQTAHAKMSENDINELNYEFLSRFYFALDTHVADFSEKLTAINKALLERLSMTTWQDILSDGPVLTVFDEADAKLRNLPYPSHEISGYQQVAGVGETDGSRLASRTLQKAEALHARQHRGETHRLMVTTATPIVNSPIELYNWARLLDRRPIYLNSLNRFLSHYVAISSVIERKPSGYGNVFRVRGLRNLPSLIAWARKWIEIGDGSEAFPSSQLMPEVLSVNVTSPIVGDERLYLEHLPSLAGAGHELMLFDALRRLSVHTPLAEKSPVYASLKSAVPQVQRFTDALYLKLGKAATAARLAAHLSRLRPETYQLFFVNYASNEKLEHNITSALIENLRLQGFSSSELLVVDKPLTERDIRDINNGKYRCIIGSPFRLGMGINIQKNAIAGHFFSPEYTPRVMQQAMGRIHRYGNQNGQVFFFTYLKDGVDDLFSKYAANKANIIDTFASYLISGKPPDNLDFSYALFTLAEIESIATGDDRLLRLRQLLTRIGAADELGRECRQSLASLETALKEIQPVIMQYKAQAENFSQILDIDQIRAALDVSLVRLPDGRQVPFSDAEPLTDALADLIRSGVKQGIENQNRGFVQVRLGNFDFMGFQLNLSFEAISDFNYGTILLNQPASQLFSHLYSNYVARFLVDSPHCPYTVNIQLGSFTGNQLVKISQSELRGILLERFPLISRQLFSSIKFREQNNIVMLRTYQRKESALLHDIRQIEKKMSELDLNFYNLEEEKEEARRLEAELAGTKGVFQHKIHPYPRIIWRNSDRDGHYRLELEIRDDESIADFFRKVVNMSVSSPSAVIDVMPISSEMVPAETVEVAPIEATPVEAAPVEAAPVEAAPVEAAPVEAAPVEAAPVEAVPVEAAPVEAAPVEAVPVETAPVETTPVETTPVETARVEVASGESPRAIEEGTWTPRPTAIPLERLTAIDEILADPFSKRYCGEREGWIGVAYYPVPYSGLLAEKRCHDLARTLADRLQDKEATPERLLRVLTAWRSTFYGCAPEAFPAWVSSNTGPDVDLLGLTEIVFAPAANDSSSAERQESLLALLRRAVNALPAAWLDGHFSDAFFNQGIYHRFPEPQGNYQPVIFQTRDVYRWSSPPGQSLRESARAAGELALGGVTLAHDQFFRLPHSAIIWVGEPMTGERLRHGLPDTARRFLNMARRSPELAGKDVGSSEEASAVAVQSGRKLLATEAATASLTMAWEETGESCNEFQLPIMLESGEVCAPPAAQAARALGLWAGIWKSGRADDGDALRGESLRDSSGAASAWVEGALGLMRASVAERSRFATAKRPFEPPLAPGLPVEPWASELSPGVLRSLATAMDEAVWQGRADVVETLAEAFDPARLATRLPPRVWERWQLTALLTAKTPVGEMEGAGGVLPEPFAPAVAPRESDFLREWLAASDTWDGCYLYPYQARLAATLCAARGDERLAATLSAWVAERELRAAAAQRRAFGRRAAGSRLSALIDEAARCSPLVEQSRQSFDAWALATPRLLHRVEASALGTSAEMDYERFLAGLSFQWAERLETMGRFFEARFARRDGLLCALALDAQLRGREAFARYAAKKWRLSSVRLSSCSRDGLGLFVESGRHDAAGPFSYEPGLWRERRAMIYQSALSAICMTVGGLSAVNSLREARRRWGGGFEEVLRERRAAALVGFGATLPLARFPGRAAAAFQRVLEGACVAQMRGASPPWETLRARWDDVKRDARGGAVPPQSTPHAGSRLEELLKEDWIAFGRLSEYPASGLAGRSATRLTPYQHYARQANLSY